MKCPNCNHIAGTALLKCSSCGEVYERGALELFQNLEYLLKWLEEREQAADLKADVHERLRTDVQKRFDAAHAALHLSPPKPPAVSIPAVPVQPAPPVAAPPQTTSVPAASSTSLSPAKAAPLLRALGLVEGTQTRVREWIGARLIGIASADELVKHLNQRTTDLKALLADQSAAIEPATDAQITQYVLGSIKLWTQNSFITEAEAAQLNDYLLKPQRPTMPEPAASTSQAAPTAPATIKEQAPVAPVVVPPIPKKPAPPPVPPKPARPPINWNKVWEQTWELVVSGALLRGLLYLGAFMIVVSAVVLVVAYWQFFSWPVQLGFISAVPLTFYISGFVLRSRLKIPVAGGVFTGIGALLVAVDFAAVYQIGGLRGLVDVQIYWLVASIVCSAIYVFTSWRVRGEFFAYLTLIGFASTAIALVSVLNWPLEWRIASATACGATMLGAAIWLRERPGDVWHDIATASRRLPQLIILVSLFLIMLVPGEPALGQMAAFLFAAVGYGLVAAYLPHVAWVHLSAWCSAIAVGFGLRGFGLPAQWYATASAGISPVYFLIGRWQRTRLNETDKARRGYVNALNLTGVGLVLVAIATGLITLIVDIWAGVIALTLAAGVLAWCAYFFRRPTVVFLASGLFILPFTIAVARELYVAEIPHLGAWLMTGWMVLSITYLGIAALLRRAEAYGSWLNLWAHGLVPLAMMELLFDYGLFPHGWVNVPTLAALGGVIGVYVLSAVLHDNGHHPALSRWLEPFPATLRQTFFLWPVAILVPVWAAIAWWGTVFDREWLGVVLAGMGVAYVGVGQLLKRRKAEYSLPPHTIAYGLAVAGVVIALTTQLPLMLTLLLVVAMLAALGAVYRRTLETSLAGAIFLWPFQLALQYFNLTPYAYSLAYALLASLGYVPLGIVLSRTGRQFSLPQYVLGYGLAALSVIASLGGRFNVYSENIPWIGVAVPLIVTGLQVFSVYRFKHAAFGWAAAAIFPIGFGKGLTLLQVPPAYDALAWVGLAFAYVLLERGLAQAVIIGSSADKLRERSQAFRWPLGIGAIVLCTLGLFVTMPDTIATFLGLVTIDPLPILLAQSLALVLLIVAARLYQSRWPLFLEPVLAFVAITLFFNGYGNALLGASLVVAQYGVLWSVLGIVHLAAAVLLDRRQVRYSQGLYLGGYGLAAFAVLWALNTGWVLVWTLGLGLVVAVASALLVHFNRHRFWDELINPLVVPDEVKVIVRGLFIWVAAWGFPAWCTLLLQQLNVVDGVQWLGFGIPALLMVGLAVWLRRFERTYAWPLTTAAQFYTLLGLALTVPVTIRTLAGTHSVIEGQLVVPFIVLQVVAVLFYAASAWAHKTRFFAHVAAWLVIVPYTLIWIRFGPTLTVTQFALVWVGLAVALLAIGFLLDRNRIRYAHGPYGAGYLLALFALAWSIPDRIVNLYTLGTVIVVALASHALMHYELHRSFDDFVRFIWRTEGTVARRAAQSIFLFFAAYAFPVWLAQLMAYNDVPLAWRGLGLALAAPIYIAFGLAARRIRSEYTWPLYSAGYALTAIGAMLAFNNEAVAIYVLALNAVVYAASAYIFRQSFWLYLSNSLIPVIALLTLHYNQRLEALSVAWMFIGLAFAYFAIAQLFQRRPATQTTPPGPSKGDTPWHARGVSTFALAFLAPAYVLSAVAMAVASGDKGLAIGVYSAGVVLYAASAWVLRESVFLYPAVWLAAVPYYLIMTLSTLPTEWYGIGWMPLIVACILIGKFVFHRRPLSGFRSSIRTVLTAEDSPQPLSAFEHPALPFYLLAYGLSVSMILLSQPTALTFTVAWVLAAVIYFGSAALFRRPVWLYPGLLAAHMGLLTYLSINPTNTPVQYTSMPFLVFTWLIALVGYFFSVRSPVAQPDEEGRSSFKLGRWQLHFGNMPIIGHLITPSWAQPFFFVTALDVIFWQWVALGRYETAIIVAVGFMLLLMLFATLWQDFALAYGAVFLLVLAAGYRFHWQGGSLPEWFASMGGLGLGLYLLGRLAERAGAKSKSDKPAPTTVWLKPLTDFAVMLTGLAVLITLPTVTTTPVSTAAALGFAGVLYLTIAFRGRYYRLGYAAIALLQFSWVLLLRYVDAGEPQLFAIPAGLYFIGMGYLERRRSHKLFAVIVETFGLIVLLLTSFIQSLYGGSVGVPYFVLLLVEALAVIGWGAWRRLKIPFFIGLGASVLNVAGQIVVLFGGGSTLTRWAIIGSAGLLLVFAAVFVERQRVLIIAKAKEWREALETWE